jgi:hypothetical protein
VSQMGIRYETTTVAFEGVLTRTKLDGTHADDDSLLGAMRAGGRGYPLKGKARQPATAGKLFPELSDREREVPEQLARDSATTRLPRTSSSPRRPCATTWPRSS